MTVAIRWNQIKVVVVVLLQLNQLLKRRMLNNSNINRPHQQQNRLSNKLIRLLLLMILKLLLNQRNKKYLRPYQLTMVVWLINTNGHRVSVISLSKYLYLGSSKRRNSMSKSSQIIWESALKAKRRRLSMGNSLRKSIQKIQFGILMGRVWFWRSRKE